MSEYYGEPLHELNYEYSWEAAAHGTPKDSFEVSPRDPSINIVMRTNRCSFRYLAISGLYRDFVVMVVVTAGFWDHHARGAEGAEEALSVWVRLHAGARIGLAPAARASPAE